MDITNQARDFIQDVMNEHDLSTVRVVFSGMG
ncbi:hypothetical protein SAMN05192534_101340 [Alteribacillus persepolensis]|uniref:Uncharacterized protein n=1 Tax=Alteribacillus persepolensis TaxID=568899 RepID=A0A1G7Z1C9_9BACI|nr:hypothetical protein SAMN05192534_101340 [Alteribacillus persepolensis]